MSIVILDQPQAISSSDSQCKFKLPKGTKRVLWQITNLCNYQCSYCIFASGPNKPKNELSTGRALELIQEFAELGFLDLKLTGGEPLTRRDFSQIITALKASSINFDLSTNASLLTQEKVELLASANPRYVHISLDGPNQFVQEMIRGANTFNPTITGIKKLVAAGVRVRLGTVLYSGNQELIAEMVEYAISLGVAEIVFSIMIPAGRLKNDSSFNCTISAAKASAMIDATRQRYQDLVKISSNFESSTDYNCETCPGGESFIYIDNQGHVLPCTWAYEANLCKKSQKTLENHSLKDLLQQNELLSFRSQIKQSAKSGCPVDHLYSLEGR